MLLLFLRTGVCSTLWVLLTRNVAGDATAKESENFDSPPQIFRGVIGGFYLYVEDKS